MNEERIRIAIADDHPVVRRGLHAFLASQPGFEVVAECGDGSSLLAMLVDTAVDDTGTPHYVFGRVGQDTAALTVRGSWTFTPNLSLQFYAQPFVAVGAYTELKEATDPGASEHDERYTPYRGGQLTRDGDPYVKEIREKYAKQRGLVMDTLRSVPNLSLPDPMGGFYAFPEVKGLKDSLSFAKKLLLETGVGMAPGIAFGPAGEGYMRMCFAASDAVLVPALEKFKGFVEKQLPD